MASPSVNSNFAIIPKGTPVPKHPDIYRFPISLPDGETLVAFDGPWPGPAIDFKKNKFDPAPETLKKTTHSFKECMDIAEENSKPKLTVFRTAMAEAVADKSNAWKWVFGAAAAAGAAGAAYLTYMKTVF
jgi:hypothetical protein